MPEFNHLQRQFQEQRSAARNTRDAHVRAQERLKALDRRIKAAERSGNKDHLARLKKERQVADAAARTAREKWQDVLQANGALLGEFVQLLDPVAAVGMLSDDVPIALFPLRIETRYRVMRTNGRTGYRLLVRVYPDDILVDNFQPEISNAEVANLTLYWTQRWRAGGRADGIKTAWMALAKAHGPGRANWLIDQYRPASLANEPVADANEYLLVIRPSTPVPTAEQAVIATFWRRIWSTRGAERDEAFGDLVKATGDVRAAAIEATLVPVNLSDPDGRPDGKRTGRVVYLNLPDPATLPRSADDWTRAAHSWMLPERLVLLGFQGGEQVLRQDGATIPADLQIGPDPAVPDGEQIRADGADLDIPEAMRWMIDFDAAVKVGMGFSVDLLDRGLDPGFDRLFVLGVRTSSDANEGAAEVERLISHHQATRKGFSLLPQGQPTNNTDESRSSYSWWEDLEKAYADYLAAASPPSGATDWRNRHDGDWLAGLLGIDPAVLARSAGAHGRDQAEARAINVALWPATLGYYMQEMMGPVFSPGTVRRTRVFFNRFVIGRGTLPLVRIGKQPYGFLPATAWSRMGWWRNEGYPAIAKQLGLPDDRFLAQIDDLSRRARNLWQTMAGDVPWVGRKGDDPQQMLLNILALNPASVEFYQRYSQSFTQYYNRLGFEDRLVSEPVNVAARQYVEAGMLALSELGWSLPEGTQLPELLSKIYNKKANLLKGDLVAPALSEADHLPVNRPDGLNYIQWLAAAARTSHDRLRKQEGFATDAVPTALLYLLLHHALDLSMVDGGFDLIRDQLGLDAVADAAQRREPAFSGIRDQAPTISRWEHLYKPNPAITGDNALLLGAYLPIAVQFGSLYLSEQLGALDLLQSTPTARLERALVDHVDTLSYRLDAWLMGIQAVQLSAMRNEDTAGFGKRGLLVGAYGWVENLAPKEERLQSVMLDPELAAIFDAPDAEPMQKSTANFGHIHAPSLDQAVTAAILRNGHLAHRTPSHPELLAIDLSSERVRMAEKVIEGMRNGQSLGALLGYRLERTLHDVPDLYLDPLIYVLRAAFPLLGNRNRRTKVPDLNDIRKVEARNVINGEAFADHIETTGHDRYPYGLGDLPSLSEFTSARLPDATEIGKIIDQAVAQMREIGDAVADLGFAESVYQLVRGNHDRAAASLDAFSKGAYPPKVEVTATPRSGRTLMHRIGLHLPGGVLPTTDGITTPRGQGEPALALWLASQLPNPATIFARVRWTDAGGGGVLTPHMGQLELAPVDLFYLIDAGGARDMAGFDELLIDYAEQHGNPRADAVYSLEYRPDGVAGLTLFEVAPLVRALRGAVLGARPLRPSDSSLESEASKAEDGVSLRPDKVATVRTKLTALAGPVDTFVEAVDPVVDPTADPVVIRDTARDTIDQWIQDYGAIARSILPFGSQAGGVTAAVEGRRAPFEAMRKSLSDIIARWARKANDFATIMVHYRLLPDTASDADRLALLINAGRTISTSIIAPVRPDTTIQEVETAVDGLKANFDNARAALVALHDNAAQPGALLIAIEGFKLQYEAIDLTPFDLSPFRDAVRALAQALHARASHLRADIAQRLDAADAAVTRSITASGDKAQQALAEAAQAMLGSTFMLLPEFALAAPRLAEWGNSWADREVYLDHLKTGTDGSPFPIDDWLHGVARVRERMRHWEMVGLLGEPLGATTAASLDALQFPHRPNDVWLGLAFPAIYRDGVPFVLDGDRLLYTAHFAAGAQVDTSDSMKLYSGLLIDEWTEVVPATQETTGLAFHYDRPNTEAPQTVLLVTPPNSTGNWQWQDIVDAMHETLDLARLRAVEPAQINKTALGPLVPTVMSAVTMLPITAMLNFAINNNLHLSLEEADHE